MNRHDLRPPLARVPRRWPPRPVLLVGLFVAAARACPCGRVRQHDGDDRVRRQLSRSPAAAGRPGRRVGPELPRRRPPAPPRRPPRRPAPSRTRATGPRTSTMPLAAGCRPTRVRWVTSARCGRRRRSTRPSTPSRLSSAIGSSWRARGIRSTRWTPRTARSRGRQTWERRCRPVNSPAATSTPRGSPARRSSTPRARRSTWSPISGRGRTTSCSLSTSPPGRCGGTGRSTRRGSSPAVEQQRGALALNAGRVYVPFGGLYGDCGPYKGAVVSVAADGSGDLASYIVPTSRMAGIWNPAGPAVDGAGDLWVTTGNSAGQSTFDYGNALIRLSPELQVIDYFAPADWARLNAGDVDLGSLGPVLLPGGRVLAVGKAGVAYLVDAGEPGPRRQAAGLARRRVERFWRRCDLRFDRCLHPLRRGAGGTVRQGGQACDRLEARRRERPADRGGRSGVGSRLRREVPGARPGDGRGPLQRATLQPGLPVHLSGRGGGQGVRGRREQAGRVRPALTGPADRLAVEAADPGLGQSRPEAREPPLPASIEEQSPPASQRTRHTRSRKVPS